MLSILRLLGSIKVN